MRTLLQTCDFILRWSWSFGFASPLNHWKFDKLVMLIKFLIRDDVYIYPTRYPTHTITRETVVCLTLLLWAGCRGRGGGESLGRGGVLMY